MFSQNNVEDINQITEKRAQKESKLRNKNRLLAVRFLFRSRLDRHYSYFRQLGRSRIVEKALHEKCMHLFREISQKENAVPDIPIFSLGSYLLRSAFVVKTLMFCVGSRDYLYDSSLDYLLFDLYLDA